MDNFQQTYSKSNRTFYKKAVFRIGISAGFFSEYNNMIFAMHYCLVNKIRFVLNSSKANFSFNKGWQDYFLPFTSEYTFYLNSYYNSRMASPDVSRLRDEIGYAIYRLWLKARKIDFTTWQIFEEARRQDRQKTYSTDIKELSGTLSDNCGIISNYVWRYQPSTKLQIDSICEAVTLPADYVGIHIRRGDKSIETNVVIPVEDYIDKAEELSSCRNAFIATDDYAVIEELEKKYPLWRFYTLCKPVNTGYDQNRQALKDKVMVKEDMLNLFADVELLCKSIFFIGTYSSNIATYIGMRMSKSKCYGVDFDEWRIW